MESKFQFRDASPLANRSRRLHSAVRDGLSSGEKLYRFAKVDERFDDDAAPTVPNPT